MEWGPCLRPAVLRMQVHSFYLLRYPAPPTDCLLYNIFSLLIGRCSLCEYDSKRQDNLLKHIATRHGKEAAIAWKCENSTKSMRNNKCSICHVVLTSGLLLKKHMVKEHTGELGRSGEKGEGWGEKGMSNLRGFGAWWLAACNSWEASGHVHSVTQPITLSQHILSQWNLTSTFRNC